MNDAMEVNETMWETAKAGINRAQEAIAAYLESQGDHEKARKVRMGIAVGGLAEIIPDVLREINEIAEQPKREPMEDLKQYSPEIQYYGNEPSAYMAELEDGGYIKLEDVQAKIDNGELMIVKTVKLTRTENEEETYCFLYKCECSAWSYPGSNFCPGCGAKITH